VKSDKKRDFEEGVRAAHGIKWEEKEKRLLGKQGISVDNRSYAK